jgi:hypothetical protein
MLELVHELEDSGEAEHLAAMEVDEAFGYLWARLQDLTEVMPVGLRVRVGPGGGLGGQGIDNSPADLRLLEINVGRVMVPPTSRVMVFHLPAIGGGKKMF